MKRHIALLALLCYGGLLQAQILQLSGSWTLVDTASVAVNRTVHLPGTLDDATVGMPNTLPVAMGREQLRHLTRRHRFVGTATYTRSITIPKRMAGRPLLLELERVMWKSRLQVDGQDYGSQESLVAPHVFSLPQGLTAGTHTLTLTIDNRKQYDISYDEMAHSYTDETQIKWNGVLGYMCLRVEPAVPRCEVDGKRVRVEVDEQGRWQSVLPTDLSPWDEFHPQLHTLTISTPHEPDTHVRFGVRSLSGEGGVLRVNGCRTFLRGTLECCIFPLTGTPPMDDAGWLPVFQTAKAWGLNHLRFHSYCPPDAAFRVADSLGFYLQVELPVWSLRIGQDTAANRFLCEESDRILATYGHHPSLCFLSCGNELQPDFQFLNHLVERMKQRVATVPTVTHLPVNRPLFSTTTFTFEKGHGGHPEPADDFWVTQWTDHGWVRGQGVFDAEPPAFDRNYEGSLRDVTVPFISHEIGQYAVYPNLREIARYTGVLDPINLKAIREDMSRKGLLEEADA